MINPLFLSSVFFFFFSFFLLCRIITFIITYPTHPLRSDPLHLIPNPPHNHQQTCTLLESLFSIERRRVVACYLRSVRVPTAARVMLFRYHIFWYIAIYCLLILKNWGPTNFKTGLGLFLLSPLFSLPFFSALNKTKKNKKKKESSFFLHPFSLLFSLSLSLLFAHNIFV